MHTFNKIIITFKIFLILIALFFSASLIYRKINYFKISFPYFFGKALYEKYEIMDGDFYRFISFCKDIIPAGSEAIFYNSWNIYRKLYPNNTYYMFDYHKQKGKFYLYPIITHVFAPGEKKLASPWDIMPEREDKILKRVSYIIAYYLDREFPGFKIKYKYDANSYILVKEE